MSERKELTNIWVARVEHLQNYSSRFEEPSSLIQKLFINDEVIFKPT